MYFSPHQPSWIEDLRGVKEFFDFLILSRGAQCVDQTCEQDTQRESVIGASKMIS